MKAALYREYLDREMTIMGVLCAYCALTVPAVLNAVGGAAAGTAFALIWSHARVMLLAGSLCTLGAALFFYRQRSLLAWYYGQIALDEAQGGEATRDLLHLADGWSTWIFYRAAFALLLAGFADYGLAAVWSRPGWGQVLLAAAAPGVALVYAALVACAFARHPHDDHPWRAFFGRANGR